MFGTCCLLLNALSTNSHRVRTKIEGEADFFSIAVKIRLRQILKMKSQTATEPFDP